MDSEPRPEPNAAAVRELRRARDALHRAAKADPSIASGCFFVDCQIMGWLGPRYWSGEAFITRAEPREPWNNQEAARVLGVELSAPATHQTTHAPRRTTG